MPISNGNDSTVNLMIYFISHVSLWYRPCYKNMLNYENKSKCQKLTTI